MSYNDYELLYLQAKCNERAEEILYQKYGILISKRIRDFKLENDYEDIYQECLIELSKAIDTYDDSKAEFYQYFNIILNNKLISVVRRKNKLSNKSLVFNDCVFELRDAKSNEIYDDFNDDDYFNGLTNLEKLLIDLRYNKLWTVKKIAYEYDLKEMQVYYRLNNAKKKIIKNYERKQ